jgi:uncharacterized protein
MSNRRDGYPAGVPCWVDAAQSDPKAAAEFYGGLFGWEFEERVPGQYAIGRLNGLDVAGVVRDEPAAWITYVAVESADATAAAAREAGGKVLVEPFDVQEAGRAAVLADPVGAVFSVWEAKGHHGAQFVNGNGAWVSSDLYTPDVDTAAAFYGAVFGWELSPIHFGDAGEGYMWRRPGYAEHLETLEPGITERHRRDGAPEGFTDCVGWLTRDSGPARWGVTFTVDDPDATAARAEELGGSIVMPPFEAGPVRMAVISDPGGAIFSVSRYQPEAS